MRRVPTSVIVIGVIGIVLGSLGFMGFLVTIAVQLSSNSPGVPGDPLENDLFYNIVTIAGVVIAVPMTIYSIVASIASLRLRPWARKGMIFYAWYSIAHPLIALIIFGVYALPKLYAASAAPGAAAELRDFMIFATLVNSCGVLISPIFPAFILYFFKRKHVIDAFNGTFPPPAAFPVEYHRQPSAPVPQPKPPASSETDELFP